MNELQKLETFRRDLALAESFEEIQLIGEAAGAYADFARKMNVSKGKQDEIGEFRIEIQEKLGEWLEEKYPQGRPEKNKVAIDGNFTMPVNAQKSSRARALKDMPDEEKFEIISEIKADENTVVTPNAVIDRYKKKKAESKKKKFKENIEKEIEDIESGKLPELKGLYDIISIDPPWPYGRGYDPLGSRVGSPYPEMDIEDIKAIELPLKENAVIFLWTTHQFLPAAFEIMQQWDLDYKATLVWDKEKLGMGTWLRMQCEFSLVGIMGNPYWENTTHRDIIREARREHSRKPDAFYELVNKICLGRKLEYFSREQRAGWEVFGNDVNKYELAR